MYAHKSTPLHRTDDLTVVQILSWKLIEIVLHVVGKISSFLCKFCFFLSIILCAIKFAFDQEKDISLNSNNLDICMLH